MKKYYVGYIGEDQRNEAKNYKSLRVTVAGGVMNCNDRDWFIPVSQCLFDEPNEVGNSRIYIPTWLFTKNQVEYARVRDIRWACYPEELVVEI